MYGTVTWFVVCSGVTSLSTRLFVGEQVSLSSNFNRSVAGNFLTLELKSLYIEGT